MSQQAEFWNRIAKKYSETPVKNQNAYESKLNNIRQLLHLRSDVLEFGCGTGSTALLLANDVRHYDAFDFSDNMIKIAKKRAATEGIYNVSFTVEDAERYANFSYEKYDLVMAHSVLHLIDDTDSVIEGMIKALKPNGYIVFSLVLLNDMALPLRWLFKLGQKTGFVPHLAYQRQSDVLAPLIRANFKIHTTWKIDKNNMFIVTQKPN